MSCDKCRAAGKFCPFDGPAPAELHIDGLLQAEIGIWQKKTFPNATPRSIFAHIKKEMKELGREIRKRKLSVCEIKAESSDILMLLFGLAENLDFRLLHECRKKLVVNKKRKWGKPDREGVVEHIRE